MIEPEVGQYWRCKFEESEDIVIWQVLDVFENEDAEIMVKEVIVHSTHDSFEVGDENNEPIFNYESNGAIADYTLDKTFNSPLYKVLNG